MLRRGAGRLPRIQQGPLTFEAPRKGTPHAKEVADANRVDPKVVGKYLGTYHDPDEDENVEVPRRRGLSGGPHRSDDVPPVEGPRADVRQVRENPLLSITFQERDGEVVSLTRSNPGGAERVCPRVR